MDLTKILTSTPIDLYEARGILNRRNGITGKLEVFDKLASVILREEKDCVTFLSNRANGYLFDLNQLVTFLNDSGAINLLVVLAAQDKDGNGFNLGDPTVMLIPCNEIKEEGPNMKNVSVMAIQGKNEQVALEHPPVTNVTQINSTNKFTFTFA
jgi:hypothetical protein